MVPCVDVGQVAGYGVWSKGELGWRCKLQSHQRPDGVESMGLAAISIGASVGWREMGRRICKGD